MDLPPKGSLLAIDLDGTLCEGEFWGGEEPKPIQKRIDWVNNLYKQGYHIIIYTARRRELYSTTEAWLIKHGVLYHAISMEKMGADLYIDDKCINIDQITD